MRDPSMFVPVHAGIRTSKKLRRFMRALNLSQPEAIGHLVLMWLTALDQCEDGRLVGFDAQDVADAAAYDGDADRFLDALMAAGWLEVAPDGVLVLHDWMLYTGHGIEARVQARERQRKCRDRRKGEGSGDTLSRDVTVTECDSHNNDRSGHVVSRDVTVTERDGDENDVTSRDMGVKSRAEKEIEIEKRDLRSLSARASTDMGVGTEPAAGSGENSTTEPATPEHRDSDGADAFAAHWSLPEQAQPSIPAKVQPTVDAWVLAVAEGGQMEPEKALRKFGASLAKQAAKYSRDVFEAAVERHVSSGKALDGRSARPLKYLEAILEGIASEARTGTSSRRPSPRAGHAGVQCGPPPEPGGKESWRLKPKGAYATWEEFKLDFRGQDWATDDDVRRYEERGQPPITCPAQYERARAEWEAAGRPDFVDGWDRPVWVLPDGTETRERPNGLTRGAA